MWIRFLIPHTFYYFFYLKRSDALVSFTFSFLVFCCKKKLEAINRNVHDHMVKDSLASGLPK